MLRHGLRRPYRLVMVGFLYVCTHVSRDVGAGLGSRAHAHARTGSLRPAAVMAVSTRTFPQVEGCVSAITRGVRHRWRGCLGLSAGRWLR